MTTNAFDAATEVVRAYFLGAICGAAGTAVGLGGAALVLLGLK